MVWISNGIGYVPHSAPLTLRVFTHILILFFLLSTFPLIKYVDNGQEAEWVFRNEVGSFFYNPTGWITSFYTLPLLMSSFLIRDLISPFTKHICINTYLCIVEKRENEIKGILGRK